MSDIELYEELLDVTELIRKGISYEMRLDAMGLERIIDLMGMGASLTSRSQSANPGILNIIHVPEHRFQSWLLKQEPDMQNEFNLVSQVQRNRRKSDLIERLEETADEFDDLVRNTGDPLDRANILDKKAKTCSALLKQLVEIEKNEDKDARSDDTQIKETYHVHVHTNEDQLERIRKLKQRE